MEVWKVTQRTSVTWEAAEGGRARKTNPWQIKSDQRGRKTSQECERYA